MAAHSSRLGTRDAGVGAGGVSGCLPQSKREGHSGEMNYPAANRGVSASVPDRHSALDTESSRASWIPACAGMTNSRQAVGNRPSWIEMVASKIGQHEWSALSRFNIHPFCFALFRGAGASEART